MGEDGCCMRTVTIAQVHGLEISVGGVAHRACFAAVYESKGPHQGPSLRVPYSTMVGTRTRSRWIEGIFKRIISATNDASKISKGVSTGKSHDTKIRSRGGVLRSQTQGSKQICKSCYGLVRQKPRYTYITVTKGGLLHQVEPVGIVRGA